MDLTRTAETSAERFDNRFIRHSTGWYAAIVLLAVYVALAVGSGKNKSPTFDEPVHLAGGYAAWTRNDYRLIPEVGNLSQRWITLPLLLNGYKFSPPDQFWKESDRVLVGDSFLHEQGNDLEGMLWRARAMAALLGAALAGLVYAWSQRLFGPLGGMLSLIACILDPSVIANGGMASSDIAAALFFLLSTFCFWKVLHKVTFGTLAASCLATAGLFLSKMSAPLILPVAGGMIVFRLLRGHPLPVGLSSRTADVRQIAGRGSQVLVLLCAAVIHFAVVVAMIWAFFGFRYSQFSPAESKDARMWMPWSDVLKEPSVSKSTVSFAKERHLLPEAYLYGTAYTLEHASRRRAFLNGSYSYTGWPWFFPYCLLVKTPLPLFALLALATAAAVRRWRSSENGIEKTAASTDCTTFRRAAGTALYETAPLWIFLAVYWIAAIRSNLNIGQRHILPVYGPMFILAGGSVRWLRFGRRGMAGIIASCVAILVVETAITWPNYLAYFNQLVGGSQNGYRHLVDSSLDWGQDLPGLKVWLDRHGLSGKEKPEDLPVPVYLSYFGVGRPEHYGIVAYRLLGYPDCGASRELFRLTGGVYCFSATMLQSVYLKYWGSWNAAYEREYQDCVQKLRAPKRMSL